jgi:hypothetical protein
MASLRAFLKLQPQPTLLACEYADDDREPRKIRVGEARTKFRDAERACAGAVRVEALDDEGALLRIWEADDAPQQEAAQAVKAHAAAAPTANNTEQMLTTIARLLVEAADSAATRQTEVLGIAFQQQAALTELMSNRLAQLEGVWQQSLMQRAEDLAEDEANAPEPSSGSDPNAQMITTLLQGAVMQQMAAAGGNGKTGS